MTVREILHVGNPLLRERCTRGHRRRAGTPETQQLIDDLIDTMHAANGAGIAAPQVGELVRIATIEVTHNPRYPYKPPIPLTIVVNPVIDAARRRAGRDQRGLPVRAQPARQRDAPRQHPRPLPRIATATQHDEVKRGLTAGTFQHECDHLDGVLFLDRVHDSHTLTTWEQFERFHRDEFVERITEFVERVGS